MCVDYKTYFAYASNKTILLCLAEYNLLYFNKTFQVFQSLKTVGTSLAFHPRNTRLDGMRLKKKNPTYKRIGQIILFSNS